MRSDPSPSSSHRKYNTLIQAQARELSHLRQRMREGRGVCHILTQHLGDTTKVPAGMANLDQHGLTQARLG